MPRIAFPTGSLPSPCEARVVPPRRRAIIPGTNEERLSLRGALTDTSPTHLSTNQTAGVGGHIELRVVVGKLGLHLFLLFLHPPPYLPLYLCHLVISDRVSFAPTLTPPVSALHALPCICAPQPPKKCLTSNRPNGHLLLMITKLNKCHYSIYLGQSQSQAAAVNTQQRTKETVFFVFFQFVTIIWCKLITLSR